MAEREPTVIERMAKAYVTEPGYSTETGYDRSAKSDVAMLAAVRVLREFLLKNQECTWSPSEAIGLLILDHERATADDR